MVDTPTLPKVAAIQINSNGSLEQRLDRIATQAKKAVDQQAQLLVLPENFAYFGESDTCAIADKESSGKGIARAFINNLAKELNTWIVAGTLPLWDESCPQQSKPFATTLIYSPGGETSHRYNKQHLFDVSIPEQNFHYKESNSFATGTGETLVFDSPIGKIGVVVCFDLRFPQMILKLVNQGAQIIVAPSAFTKETGKHHWRLLLRARAIDSLCYIVGSNLAGREQPSKATWGGSAIVDPWGKVINEMEDEEGCIVAEIDLKKQRQIRARMPLIE